MQRVTGHLLLLASATGMRFGELRHLKWRDVDPASLRVHVSEKPEGARIATHFYNNETDIDTCVDALVAFRERS